MSNRLLIIDGDTEHKESLVQFFTGRDFEVQSTDDFDEALRKLKRDQFDIVVSDFFIGEKTADDICDYLEHQSLTQTVILIMNNRHNASTELRIRHYSPAFYFVKPFHVEDLYAVVLKISLHNEQKSIIQKRDYKCV